METDPKRVLELLKRELEFLNGGGYKRCARFPWRAAYIFEESPSCPNYADRRRAHSCQECWLMQFVSPELREEEAPCRFVQLDGPGVTVDSLYRCGTLAESEEALRNWLQRRIRELESQPAEMARRDTDSAALRESA
jgi:hypothetical protein